jgi:hypothetical protein
MIFAKIAAAVALLGSVQAFFVDEAQLKYTSGAELEDMLQSNIRLNQAIKHNIVAERRARISTKPLVKRVTKNEFAEILEAQTPTGGGNTYWRGVLESLTRVVEGETA